MLLQISIVTLLAKIVIAQCPTGALDTYCANGHKSQISTGNFNTNSTSYWVKASALFNEKMHCRHSVIINYEHLQSEPELVSIEEYRERPNIDRMDYSGTGFLIEMDINCERNDSHSLMFARNRYGDTVRMFTELQGSGVLKGAMMQCDVIKSNQARTSWCFSEGGANTAASMLSTSRLEFLNCHNAFQIEPYCVSSWTLVAIPSAVKSSFRLDLLQAFIYNFASDMCWRGISASSGLRNWSQFSGIKVGHIDCK